MDVVAGEKKEEKPKKEEDNWNKLYNMKPRLMENGHWSVPFSACFVIKKIKDFKPEECTMEVAFTLIMRCRFTGMYNMKECMDTVIEKLKCRVNEEESPMISETRSGKYVKTRSSSCKKDEPEDMVQYTLRLKEQFLTHFDEYADFPFDNLNFSYRFELSHFEMPDPQKPKEVQTVRFDFYETTVNPISWKDKCDFLPEFDIDYENTTIYTLVERKPWKPKKDSKKEDEI